MLLMLPGVGWGLPVRQTRVLDKSLPRYWLLSSPVAPPTSKVFIASGCRSPGEALRGLGWGMRKVGGAKSQGDRSQAAPEEYSAPKKESWSP